MNLRSWLESFESRSTTSNSYWSVFLAENIHVTHDKSIFQLPYFFVEEEVEKENKEGTYISPQLRELFFHLIKMCIPEQEIRVFNYVDLLRHLITTEILPARVESPLALPLQYPDLSRHNKIWLLYELLRLGYPHEYPHVPPLIGKDSLSNEYYLVKGGRLYVKLVSETLKPQLEIDSPISLEQYHERLPKWISLAETIEEWNEVVKVLGSELNEIYLGEAITERLGDATASTISEVVKDQQRLALVEKYNMIRKPFLTPTTSDH